MRVLKEVLLVKDLCVKRLTCSVTLASAAYSGQSQLIWVVNAILKTAIETLPTFSMLRMSERQRRDGEAQNSVFGYFWVNLAIINVPIGAPGIGYSPNFPDILTLQATYTPSHDHRQ